MPGNALVTLLGKPEPPPFAPPNVDRRPVKLAGKPEAPPVPPKLDTRPGKAPVKPGGKPDKRPGKALVNGVRMPGKPEPPLAPPRPDKRPDKALFKLAGKPEPPPGPPILATRPGKALVKPDGKPEPPPVAPAKLDMMEAMSMRGMLLIPLPDNMELKLEPVRGVALVIDPDLVVTRTDLLSLEFTRISALVGLVLFSRHVHLY